MTPPTPREFEEILDALLQDRIDAYRGDPTTHWEKTRAYVLAAYRDVYGERVTIQ